MLGWFNKPKFGVMATVLGLALALLGMRWYSYQEPLEGDLTTYAVIAHEMLHGRELYSDLWDIKPPAVFFTYAAAELLVGYGIQSIFLLNVAAAWFSLAGIVAGGAAFTRNAWGGVLAGLFWVLVSGDPSLQGNQPNSEVFINAAQSWGLAFCAQAISQPDQEASARFKPLLLAGFAFAVATAYKQVSVLTPVLIAFVFLTFSHSRGWAARVKEAAALISPTFLVWALLFAYFAFQGSLSEFVYTCITMPLVYSSESSVTGVAPTFQTLAPTYFLGSLVALGIWGTALNRTDWRKWVVLWGSLAASAGAVILPGKYWPHYFQLLMPPLCLLATTGVLEIWQAPRWRWSGAGAGAAVALWLLARQIPWFQIPPEQWSIKKYKLDYFLVMRNLGGEIKSALLPQEKTIYVHGLHSVQSGIYFYSGKSPAAGTISTQVVREGPRRMEYARRTIEQLSRVRPEMVVVTDNDSPDPVTDWIAKHYRMVGHEANLLLLVRVGGDLERRLPKR